MSETDSKPELNMESEKNIGSVADLIHKQDSEQSHDESMARPVDGHDNKGFHFGEDPYDPNNRTNTRFYSKMNGQSAIRLEPPSSSTGPPPYHPSVTNKATDAYTPSSNHMSVPHPSTSRQSHRFEPTTNGTEPSLHNNNIATISHTNGRTVNGPHNVDIVLNEDQSAMPYRTKKDKPKEKSLCATLGLICCIFFFLFMFLAVGVFATVYFTILFPESSRGDVNKDEPTTISPTISFPPVEEISVGVSMTLNQTYQIALNNILSTEYQDFVDSFTQAMASTFSNSELMDVYVRTDVETISPGSIVVDSILYLNDVPPGLQSNSQPNNSPVEQIRVHTQTLVLATLQDAAETDNSALSLLDVHSNSIIVDTPEVTIALPTTPPTTTQALQPASTKLTVTQKVTTSLKTTQSLPTTSIRQSTVSTTQSATQSATSTTQTLTQTTAPLPTTEYQDTDPPVVTCPADIEQFSDPGQPSAIVTWNLATATDNSGSVASLTSDFNSGSPFAIGDTAVTYTATDETGNTGNCTFKITVIDNELPLLLCPSTVRTETNLGEHFATGVTWDNVFATDNSRFVFPAEGSHDENSMFLVGPTTVIYTALDPSGNRGNCSFFVIVEDKEGPQLTCPEDIVQSTDQDLDSTTVTWNEPIIDDNNLGQVTLESNYDSGSSFVIGQYVVVFMATDEAGNQGQCSFVITVEDNQVPVLTCPDDQSRATDPSLNTAVVSWSSVTVVDNSGAYFVPFSDHPSGSTFPLGSTDVTYSVTDANGNTGTCTFSVTVLDNEPPTITCPPDMTIPNDPGLATAIATWTEPTASDNSQSDVTIVPSTPSGSTFVIGGTTVRYVATDESGYSAECTFKVTVEDVEKPVIHCPANQTASADPGQMTTVVTWPEVIEEDNHGIQLSGNNPQPGSRYPVGETQVIYWAVDWAGLGSQCAFWVIVEDNEAPIVTCPGNDITAYVVIGVTEQSVYWDEPTASDNVAVEGAATCEFQNGTSFAIGMHTVECSATDVYGNVGSCTFGVRVTEPVVQASGSLTLVGTFTPSLMDPSSEDYMELEQRVVASVDQVFRSGNESNTYAKTTLTGFREGSVIADLKVGFKRSVEQDDLTTFMSDSINAAIIDGTMGGVDAVPNSAEFNDVIVPTPESGLKFDCTDQDSTIPSLSIVSIQYRYGHGCTGVLITQQHVLTAASCEAAGGTFVNILAGSETLSGQEVTAVEATVHKIYQHPGFNALTGENNLAVMELEMALPTSIAQAACLDYNALGTIDFSVYQDCFIWGWGTLTGAQFQSLQSTSVSTLSNDVPGNSCDTYTYPFVMTKNKFCASGATGSSKLCTADTGSPLMCKNQQNGWSLVGLSNGYHYNECALGMYTHVSQHWEFISSVVDNGGVSVPCDVIEAPSCAGTLNYFSTFATTQSSYETTMQTINLILTCHPDAQTFFCSALLPECELNYGLVPCRSFCDEVLQSCYAQYEALFGEGSWPIYCTDYPVGADSNALLCEKGSYSTCGDTNLQVTTEEPLTLTSPNYPNPYPDQHDCTWFIEGPEGLNLLAKFKDLGIEECCDTMTIGSGSDPMDRSSVVGQYYGETLTSGFEVILSQKMWVRLQSDYGTGMQGFSLEVYAIDSITDFCDQPYAFKCAGTTLCIPSRWRCDQVNDCTDGSDETSCPDIEQVVVPGLESRTILSPGYPVGYYSPTDQIWVITTDPGKQLNLMFMTFETEKDFDVVRIGQGSDPFVSESLFFEWSGNKIPPPIRSTGDAVWVQLMADDSIFKDGFELTVTSIEAADPILCLENQFDCGGGVCIPSGAKCDNITDCIFGRDEYACFGLRTCSANEFSCGDGQCIPLSLICDGSPECGDNSDEIGCPTRASTPPPIQTMAPTEPPKPDCNSDLCYNGAQCEDIADTFFCLCTPGYQGKLCDQEINECLPNPCKNGAICTDGLNSYSCQCVLGFMGDNCETNIDDCDTMPCESGGTCVDGINSFTCDCPLGYNGDTCEIEPCSSIDSTTCLGLLPYDTTVFPNDHATSSQDALNTLTNLASVLNCHPDAQLLHCSALFPQCPWPDYGKATTPCRSVCVDVTSACASVYESTFNEPWPFDCDTYVTGQGTFCEQAEGDVFGTGLCGTRPEASVTSRIIGGENSLPGSWPWIGSLRESFGDHQCGATLINDRWAITAAHCVGVFHSVVFGDTQLNKPSPNNKAYRFLKIFSHPDYDKTLFNEENDLAMLYLPERVDFTGFILPSCLTTIEEETLAYRDCHVIGWGHTVEDGSVSNNLQEVMLPLLSPEECRQKLGPLTVSDNMICAGQPQGGLDSCQGDSGGPLVCLGNDDVWHLVGVTSFGFGCGRAHTPGVYARVSQYVDWIENTIKETEESVQQISVELNVSQRIESPSFPAQYPSNAFVEWSFTSPPGTQIILTIISHSTETAYDYVNFGHGHDTGNMDTLIETLEDEIEEKRLYSTDSNMMWMYFVSDYSVVQAGFQYDITAVNPGDVVRCGDGVRVVLPSWVCDTVADCPNGSDEQGCP